ncbi:Valine--pyruvate aminotransferase [hydrothermal vent metagenome]|uniref:Valine--pyruvate aminotransferase n=1 Tax=hydrothermal vent metagenome TaxID=652676 RepID=A0A3B0ZF37_9ZZZZ
MRLLEIAKRKEAEGVAIVHMEIGEPDFDSPSHVIAAAQQALHQKTMHYTPAAGLPELRTAISDYYQRQYGARVNPARIVVTPGASGALQLALSVLLNPGDNILMADPSYPCNRHFVRLLEGEPISVPVGQYTNYQLTLEQCKAVWTGNTAGVLIASPANPTGSIISTQQLSDIANYVKEQGAGLIVDEIYHGLTYNEQPPTALALSDDIFVVNSFSKYFGMTGWRVGWLVVPEEYADAIEKLAQNIFLAACTLSQYAALAALLPETQVELNKRRDEFKKRRDFLCDAVTDLGFKIAGKPEGAFYIYANCQQFSNNSYDFCYELLEQTGVVITPGKDFGCYKAEHHVRFAYTTNLEQLAEGISRLRQYLRSL